LPESVSVSCVTESARASAIANATEIVPTVIATCAPPTPGLPNSSPSSDQYQVAPPPGTPSPRPLLLPSHPPRLNVSAQLVRILVGFRYLVHLFSICSESQYFFLSIFTHLFAWTY
jgi:hypothetical protein